MPLLPLTSTLIHITFIAVIAVAAATLATIPITVTTTLADGLYVSSHEFGNVVWNSCLLSELWTEMQGADLSFTQLALGLVGFGEFGE